MVLIFRLYLQRVENTTIKLVSTIVYKIVNLFNEFKMLDIDCFKVEEVMVQTTERRKMEFRKTKRMVTNQVEKKQNLR